MAAGDRFIPNEELTIDERSAVGWAVATGHPLGAAIVERVRSGGNGVTAAELAGICDSWDEAGRPILERHVHRTRVVLHDGATVTGVTFVADDPYSRQEPPSFGLYFDHRWSPPWPHAHVEWPDFGVPADIDELRRALIDLRHRARSGHAVEVGCLGGHGRTGTALACLAVLTGTPAEEAVAWVRANYCEKAVETDDQAALVRSFAD